MTDYDIKLNKDDMVGLLNNKGAMAQLDQSVLNQILEAQMTGHLGSERYFHSEKRNGVRHSPCESRQLSRHLLQ